MATVIPVDEFISDEWYPGFKPGYTHAPWYVDPVQTFRKEDEENFWFLDFHWPRGLTPMGLIWNEDGYNWSSQLAAEQMPLPPGRGITCRLGGTTSIDVTRPGIDKGYGIHKLSDVLGVPIVQMLFVGDAIFPGGNDYPAFEAGAESIEVRDPDETKRVIEAIVACLS